MPKIVPQEMKAISTVNAQPDKFNGKMHYMILLELGGATGNEICAALGMSQSRVSLIRNTPLYVEALEIERNKLQADVRERHVEKVVEGDPTRRYLQEHTLEAAQKKVVLMRDAVSEFVQSSAADSILDRSGYGVRSTQTNVNIEVTDKMFDRFEKAMRYSETGNSKEPKDAA